MGFTFGEIYWLVYSFKNTLSLFEKKTNGKNNDQIDSLLVRTVWSYSEDIGMKFGIDKYSVLELEKEWG